MTATVALLWSKQTVHACVLFKKCVYLFSQKMTNYRTVNKQVESIASDEAETPQASSSKNKSILSTCWNQTAPLFSRDLLGSTLLVLMLQGASFFGFTALVMWLPEMFNRLSARPAGTATLCDVMSPTVIEVNLLDEVLGAAGELIPIEATFHNAT